MVMIGSTMSFEKVETRRREIRFKLGFTKKEKKKGKGGRTTGKGNRTGSPSPFNRTKRPRNVHRE